MFAPLISAFQLRLEETVKRGIFSLAAVLVLVLAIGFFAFGGWFALESRFGAVAASFTVGTILIVVAALLAIVARRRRIIVATPAAAPVAAPVTAAGTGLVAMAPVLTQAFVTGFVVGLKGSRKD